MAKNCRELRAKMSVAAREASDAEHRGLIKELCPPQGTESGELMQSRKEGPGDEGNCQGES